jgi:hypothetical protein
VGHIPGSLNLPIEEFVTDDDRQMFKPASELRSVLAEAGVSLERETVVHCQGGDSHDHGGVRPVPPRLGPYSCVRRIDGGVGQPRRHAPGGRRGVA